MYKMHKFLYREVSIFYFILMLAVYICLLYELLQYFVVHMQTHGIF